MDEIAAKAGKGKSSLYYYFKSKEDVFAAVVEEETANLQNKLQETIDQQSHASEKLRNYVKTSIASIQQMANLNEAMQNEFLSNYKFIERIRTKYNEEEIATMKAILDLGVAKENFILEDTAMAARIIVRVIKAMEIPVRLEMPERNLEKEIDNIIDMILFGILKR